MQDTIIQLITIARSVWRFRWAAIALAWLVCLVGWAYVFRMPDQYQSNTRVFVDSDSILKPLLKGIAVESSDFRDQLGVMTRQLLSRANLEKVMRMVDLDINAATPKQKESIINSLESSITLNAVPSRPHGPPNIYEISSIARTPQRAKDITQSLLNIFLETAIGESRESSGAAQEFIEQQIKEYETRLEAAENRLMEYKRKNMGVLPSQDAGIFQRLQSTQADLNKTNLELMEAVNRRDEIKKHIEELRASGQLNVDTSAGNRPTSPQEARIAALQQRLDELQSKYTAEHPAVRETKQTLDLLLKEKAQREKAKGGNADADMAVSNPIFQQLKISLSEVEAQIAGLTVRKNVYQKRVVQLQKDAGTLPEVEAELQRLDRDYEINKQHYNELVKRRESAKLTENAGETGQEVKFKVIDPPRTPLAPIGPNRLMYSTGVLAAGLGLGIGLGFVLSQIRPVFYDRREVQQIIQLPVFGVVSRIWTPELLLKRKAQLAAFILIGIVLIGVYGSVAYMNYKGVNVTTFVVG